MVASTPHETEFPEVLVEDKMEDGYVDSLRA